MYEHVFDYRSRLSGSNESRRSSMSRVDIGAGEAREVIEVLHHLGNRSDLPSDARSNTNYWASAVEDEMDRRDLETVAWLLREIGGDHRLPAAERRSAHYWANYLEAQL
jgi:hypothetical protein